MKKLPACFLYVSSTSVYGQTGGEEVDETAATEPKEESGRVVLEAERCCCERLPTAIILRFAGIYGPDRLLRAKSIQAGEPIVGDAEQWLNLIHVEDGAAAVVEAAERGKLARFTMSATATLCGGANTMSNWRNTSIRRCASWHRRVWRAPIDALAIGECEKNSACCYSTNPSLKREQRRLFSLTLQARTYRSASCDGGNAPSGRVGAGSTFTGAGVATE